MKKFEELDNATKLEVIKNNLEVIADYATDYMEDILPENLTDIAIEIFDNYSVFAVDVVAGNRVVIRVREGYLNPESFKDYLKKRVIDSKSIYWCDALVKSIAEKQYEEKYLAPGNFPLEIATAIQREATSFIYNMSHRPEYVLDYINEKIPAIFLASNFLDDRDVDDDLTLA